jgi:hypothetical protein
LLDSAKEISLACIFIFRLLSFPRIALYSYFANHQLLINLLTEILILKAVFVDLHLLFNEESMTDGDSSNRSSKNNEFFADFTEKLCAEIRAPSGAPAPPSV